MNIAALPYLLRETGLRPLFYYLRYQLALKSGWAQRQTRQPPADFPAPLRDIFPLPPPQSLQSDLGEKEWADLRNEAESLRRGHFLIFGHFPVTLSSWDLGLPRRHWAEYVTGAIRAEAFLPSSWPADLKFLWEPARWGWAFRLGRAWYLLGEEPLAAAFWAFAEAFLEAHPPYLGPHWMNGQEVALRLLAMLWAAQVFKASIHTTPQRLERLRATILAHVHRLPPTLDYARAQENNHLLSEAAALIAAARALPEHPLASRWERLGARLFNQALERQISSYGEYIQHSTNYHRLMLELALYVHAVAPDVLTRAARHKLRLATHWLRSLTDGHQGRVPNLGSNDGAHFLMLTSCAFFDFRPTVEAAARAFLGESLPYSGPWGELSHWLGLLNAKEERAVALEITHRSYMGLSDVLHAPHSWGYLRATSFRSRLAHSDQLHFDLWWRGYNLACDAGTGYYNLPAPWDNPLLAARVHNTVLIHGVEPRRRLTRFLQAGWISAWSRLLLPQADRPFGGLEAHVRLAQARHTRRVWVEEGERWIVEDVLEPRRPAALHRYRLHWLLADAPWQLRAWERGLSLELELPPGVVRIEVEACAPAHILLIRAAEPIWGEGAALPYEGWIAPSYGLLRPALSLSLEIETRGLTRFITRFILPEGGG